MDPSDDAPPGQGEDPRDPFRLGDDPGWAPGARGGRPDGLVALRMTFLALGAGLACVGIVVGLLTGSVADRDPRLGGLAATGAVVVVGVVALALVRLVPIGLDCADELALARSWRARFLARCSASALPALAGLGAFVLSGIPALYALGLGFTSAGLAVSGPFHATLVRDQERLALEGCAISLVPALRIPVTDHTR